jgi:prepilin-type N-terminal cleavage/methylation domain-containing protein
MLFKKKDKIQGFTLIEVVITLSIFSIMAVIISGIFLNVNNLQKNTANFQRLQNDGRYILEKLAREIRAREVIYPLAGSNSQNLLYFKKDERNNYLRLCLTETGSLNYFLDAQDEIIAEDNRRRCLEEGYALNADDVEIAVVKFFVAPTAEDVWGDAPQTNIQPRVTILLKLRNRGSEKYRQELELQTTISSKVYKR